jgi:hypothetical protein
MKRRVLTEKGWAIAGPYGLYTGWWTTRKAAIKAHARDHVLWAAGSAGYTMLEVWKMCKKEGDRAVRVSIRYEA